MEKIEFVAPMDIEKRSMQIIGEELNRRGIHLDPEEDPVVRRAIHTSADFAYAENLVVSEQAVSRLREALAAGADIVTDTEMARAGISKKTLEKFGGRVHCFMSDPDVAEEARARGVPRATVSMEQAARLPGRCLFAIGIAPSAVFRLEEMIREGTLQPAGIIGVPVGFVNVVEAKELILKVSSVPYIVARGRKGGSNIAAAVCNALLYGMPGVKRS